ncbi:MAG TPA: hypothetical protein G4O00_07765 [Thermoflexia bacterium]|nr:hypothetical protein [Thermoflexia bacterium]
MITVTGRLRPADHPDRAVGSKRVLGPLNPRRFVQWPNALNRLPPPHLPTCPTGPTCTNRLPRPQPTQSPRTLTPPILASPPNETNTPNHHARHQILRPRPSPPALLLQPRLLQTSPRLIASNAFPGRLANPAPPSRTRRPAPPPSTSQILNLAHRLLRLPNPPRLSAPTSTTGTVANVGRTNSH